jgi:hypothetical protein
VHLAPEAELPEIAAEPTRFVVVIEAEVSYQWQKRVSDWMVEFGCLYMMAWGRQCSTWDDSVDWANVDKYDGREIPEDGFVVTTWHDDEPLGEVFWFSKSVAEHSSVDLVRTIILHICTTSRRDELLSLYERV